MLPGNYMNKIFPLTSAIFFLFTVFSYSDEALPITKDVLINSEEWSGVDWGLDSITIKFSDENYKIFGALASGEAASGKYEIKNNQLILIPDPGKVCNHLQDNKWIFVYRRSSNSLFYYDYLVRIEPKGNYDVIVWNYSTKIQNHALRKTNDISVEIFCANKAFINDDRVYVRNLPNISNGKRYVFTIWTPGEGEIDYGYFLPKGYKIRLIARTTQKYRIGKWNNYWYYVQVTVGEYGLINLEKKNTAKSTRVINAWIYGEFISYE